MVRVPSLIGRRFFDAVRVVRQAGLQQEAPGYTGTTGNPHYPGRCIEILSQSPPPGTRVPRGTTVSIVEGVCNQAIVGGNPGG